MKLIDWINKVTKLNQTTMTNFQKNINDGKVDKTGDTMSGVLKIENKSAFNGVDKVRTIDGVDYAATLGVGIDGSASLELHNASGTLGRIDINKDGKIKNYKTGKYLVEETIKKGTVKNPDSAKFNIKRSKIVQINNIVFVDLSIQLLANIPVNTQYSFKISNVDMPNVVNFLVASYGREEWKLAEAIYAGMLQDGNLYISNQNNQSASGGFWNIHFSYATV